MASRVGGSNTAIQVAQLLRSPGYPRGDHVPSPSRPAPGLPGLRSTNFCPSAERAPTEAGGDAGVPVHRAVAVQFQHGDRVGTELITAQVDRPHGAHPGAGDAHVVTGAQRPASSNAAVTTAGWPAKSLVGGRGQRGRPGEHASTSTRAAR